MSDSSPPVEATPISFYRPSVNFSDTPRSAADPLLQNGSFIDPTAEGKPKTESQQPEQSHGNGGAEQPEATPVKSRRKVPVNREAAAQAAQSAGWLPPGWLMEERPRTSGATAGLVDKYYIEPSTGRRFRSKKEVQHYLQTGEFKKKKKMENSEADPNSTEGPGTQKQKKSKKNVKARERNFDYVNVPERIEWALSNASTNVWTPFIGGQRVTEYEKQNWEFEMLHSRR